MMTSSMGRSNQRLPLAWPMSIVSALTTQVRLSLADACVMMLPLSSPSCPSRRLGGLWPPGSGCRRAQNGNGRRSQKSEHDSRCGISRATTLPSADGADDGRCGQEVAGQKVGHITRPVPLIGGIKHKNDSFRARYRVDEVGPRARGPPPPAASLAHTQTHGPRSRARGPHATPRP